MPVAAALSRSRPVRLSGAGSVGGATGFDAREMHSGMTMLENPAKPAVAAFGVDAGPMALTRKPLAQIATALAGSPNTEEEMAAAVKAIVVQ